MIDHKQNVKAVLKGCSAAFAFLSMSSIDADGQAEGIEARIYDKTHAVSEWLDCMLREFSLTWSIFTQQRRIGSSGGGIASKIFIFVDAGAAAGISDSNALSGPLGIAPRRPNSCHDGPQWGALAIGGSAPQSHHTDLAENKLDARTSPRTPASSPQHGLWRIRRCAHSAPALCVCFASVAVYVFFVVRFVLFNKRNREAAPAAESKVRPNQHLLQFNSR